MTLNPRTEEYYKKFIELQENLRKSEEERLKLEMKFNEMVHTTKEQTQMHYRKLRAQYKRFLDEDRKRQDRNEMILRNLESIETRLSMITAKTERFQLLRQQYRAMLDRIYQTKLDKSNQISHEYRQKQQKTDKNDIFERYLKNISSPQAKDLLGSDRIAKKSSDYGRNDDLSSFVDDSVEYRSNCANSLADAILQTTDKNRDQFIDDGNNNTRVMINDPTEIARQCERNPEIPIGKLPGNSTGSETDDESSDKLEDNELGKFEMNKLPKIQQIQEKLEDLKVENVVANQNQNNEHNDESLGNSDRVIDEFDTLPTEKINIQENNEPTSQPNPTGTNENNEKCDIILEEVPKANQQNIIESPEQVNEEAVSITKTPEFSTTELQSDRNMPEEKELNLRYDESPIKNQNDTDAAECSSINDQKIDNHEICEPQYDDKDENQYSLQNVAKEPDATIETDTKDDPTVQNPITEQQNDTTEQFYAEYPNSEPQYDENGQLVPQYDEHGQLLPQFDENGQFIPQYDQNGQLISQYDENGQLVPQYDQNGQLIPQFDQNGQLIPQFDQNGQLIPQYDQNGQSIPQYDQYGQVIPQYDENGQIIPHYDENGQIIPQYDENGQLIPHYDENGQPIAQYYSNTNPEYGDNNQFENYPDVEQYDTKPASVIDAEIIEHTGNNGKPTEIIEQETINKIENNEEIKIDENKESVDEEAVMTKSKPKVLEMLDTDTESIKQDTKISNDSDFDFSNS